MPKTQKTVHNGISRETMADLFEIQVRGKAAESFLRSGVEPTDEHWKILNGDREITLRDIGEIGYLTGYEMEFRLEDTPAKK